MQKYKKIAILDILKKIINCLHAYKLLKILYLSLFFVLFYFLFVNTYGNSDNFRSFNVPAMSPIGTDSRNIQVSAYCEKFGFTIFSDNQCYKKFELVKDSYPETKWIATYNYPKIVAQTYAKIFPDSEAGFRFFWTLNALALASTLLALCYKYNYLLYPIVLFSPPVLLCIERGNIDALTFSLIFFPLVLLKFRAYIYIFFIGLATSIKIFPIFAGITLFFNWRALLNKESLFSLICIAPLILYSFLDYEHFIKNTPVEFTYQFGIIGLFNEKISFLIKVTAALIFICMVCASVFIALKEYIKTNARITEDVIFMASISIFICVFLIFSSWFYRLIFIIPAAIVLSRSDIFSSVCSFIIISVLWMPFFKWLPIGNYSLVHFEAYILFSISIYYFMKAIKQQLKVPCK